MPPKKDAGDISFMDGIDGIFSGRFQPGGFFII
jgi:hypothetical protein